MTMTRNALMGEDLDTQATSKQCRKLRTMFGLSSNSDYVTADAIHRKVKERVLHEDISKDEVIVVLRVFRDYFERMEDGYAPEGSIGLRVLAEATLLHEKISGENSVDQSTWAAIELISNTLQTTTVDDVIQAATKKILPVHVDYARVSDQGMSWCSLAVNTLVCFTVVTNIFFMGVSIDFHPDHGGWLCFEAVCTTIFCFEAGYKMWTGGVSEYFAGPAATWNIMDIVVTGISLFEVGLGTVLHFGKDHYDAGARIGEATRIAVMLRMLRMVRLIRLMKLVHSPFLKDLANMLVGFVIGIPSLVWVLVLFLSVLYSMGLLFRITLGPGPDQDLLAECGWPDDYPDIGDDRCKVHWMYGEEFFPSVKTAMFTTFRFMIGDYSSRSGKSLAVAFSQGYGDFFHLVFCVGMITVQFGLFNIITAIFVDSTISGLKTNDTKRKYARQYESKFVKEKLKDLLERVGYLALTQKFENLKVRSTPSRRSRALRLLESFGLQTEESMQRASQQSRVLNQAQMQRLSRCDIEELELNEELFLQVLEDDVVKLLMQDLDVDIFNPTDLFGTFDPDESGTVTVPEMVQAVMKLRGEPVKNDVIATVVSIKSLHEKFDGLKSMVMEIIKAVDSEGSGPAVTHAVTC